MLISVAQATAAYTGLKALFMKGFMPTDPTIADMWKMVAMIAPSDTEEEEYGWLKNLSFIREWVGDRVLQNLVEANYKIKNKHFEGTIQVPVDKIRDRKLAGYAVAAEMLGQNARNFPNRLVFPLLAAGWATIGIDGQYFFDTNHPVLNPDGSTTLVSNNGGGTGTPWYLLDTTKVVKPIVYQEREPFVPSSLTSPDSDHVFKRNELLFGTDGRCNVGYGLWQCAYGSKQPLTADNVWDARQKMASIKGDNGEPLGITPNILLVGPTLEQAARTALQAVILNNTTNVLAGTMQPVVCPWLA